MSKAIIYLPYLVSMLIEGGFLGNHNAKGQSENTVYSRHQGLKRQATKPKYLRLVEAPRMKSHVIKSLK